MPSTPTLTALAVLPFLEKVKASEPYCTPLPVLLLLTFRPLDVNTLIASRVTEAHAVKRRLCIHGDGVVFALHINVGTVNCNGLARFHGSNSIAIALQLPTLLRSSQKFANC